MRRRSWWYVGSWCLPVCNQAAGGQRPVVVAPSAGLSYSERVKSRPMAPTDSAAAYDADFFAWTQRTAALLRARRFDEVDVENAAQEIEDMGRRDLRELNGRLQVVLAHLLKWQLQPQKRTASSQTALLTQRFKIDDLLRDSPSLRAKLPDDLPRNYEHAVRRAALETGLRADQFPSRCPFSLEQILDQDFLPA